MKITLAFITIFLAQSMSFAAGFTCDTSGRFFAEPVSDRVVDSSVVLQKVGENLYQGEIRDTSARAALTCGFSQSLLVCHGVWENSDEQVRLSIQMFRDGQIMATQKRPWMNENSLRFPCRMQM